MKIAIDVGHARATGARGEGLEEHEVCAQLAHLLQAELAGRGGESAVIDFPGLSNRGDLLTTVKTINAGNYALSVSLHCDSSNKPSARGAHVCYYSTQGARLATCIAAHLCALLPGRANKTMLRSDLYILKSTLPVAVLCECGFLTNAGDANLLRSNPQAVAKAIAAGLLDYMAVA